MLRNSKLNAVVASTPVFSPAPGCTAKGKQAPKIATPPEGPVPPPPTVTIQTEPTIPPVSVGPRPPEAVASPPTAPSKPAPGPTPTLAPPPTAPATAPSGRFIVLNFDNADTPPAIPPPTEIPGFTLLP